MPHLLTALSRRFSVPSSGGLRLATSSSANPRFGYGSYHVALRRRASSGGGLDGLHSKARAAQTGCASRARVEGPQKSSTLTRCTATDTSIGGAASGPSEDAKLALLREKMRTGERKLDAIIIPTNDPHQSEYVATCFARREFISDFTGSAGTAVVTQDAALLWTDGRYYLQAETQLSSEWGLMRLTDPEIHEWLCSNLPSGAVVGIDPECHTATTAQTLQQNLAKSSIDLHSMEENLVDGVWGAVEGRPALPSGALRVHPQQYAGATVQHKLQAIRSEMHVHGAGLLALSMLDEIAWLFNVRGSDIDCCPVALAYATVEEGRATLYVDPAKVGAEVQTHLSEAGVRLRPYDMAALTGDLVAAGSEGKRMWVDPGTGSLAVLEAAVSASEAVDAPYEGQSPVPLMKAMKNPGEVAGLVEAHMRDGAAVAAFFCRLEAIIGEGGSVTEVEVEEMLEGYRARQAGWIEPSFPTIAGSGPNGAIIHYHAEPGTCGTVSSESLLLLDSGGQYDCGTTDVTRTIHLGAPSQHQVECFTRVLKGNIAIDIARFPEYTPGCALDALARGALWQVGLDYRHGTGHGVGAALNVHEGPQSISPRFGNETGLREGMVLSNEPGYYEDGAFGIRIENLLLVSEAPTEFRFGGQTFLGFQKLTHIPIQAKMVALHLLTDAEIAWLDAYHAQVWEAISPRLEGQDAEREWLWANTRPMREHVPAV